MKKRYLYIVDDEESIRSALERELRRWARDSELLIKSFETPQEILKAVEADAESVWTIISDQRMPYMDGLTLIQNIHEKYPMIPMILLTGNIDIEAIVKLNPPGLFSVLEKPWEHDALIRMLDRASQFRMART
jgi:two-component system, NtrC family, nitrogen regulation response regulator GlnG